MVRLYTRMQPVPAGTDPMNTLLGRDYMWILQDEVNEIIVAAERGNSFPLPRTLAARLVVFHLIDNIRGQVWGWQPRDVSQAKFMMKPAGRDGKIRSFTLSGDFAKRSENPPHWTERGQQGHLDGEFDIDTTTRRIVRFRAFVDSQAWDRFEGRRNFSPPQGKYRLVTAIVEAPDELAQQITPEPANTGNYYLHPQVVTE